MKRARLAIYFIAFLLMGLSGCASLQGFDSTVSSFSQWPSAPPPAGTFYRFERLPSQRAGGAQQELLEDAARKALGRVGLQEGAAQARLSVQLSVVTRTVQRSPYDAFEGDGFGFASPRFLLQGGSRGSAFGLGFGLRFSEPYDWHELHLLMRDLDSNQVVFETHATTDDRPGPRLSLTVLTGLLDAALSGFPEPPTGPRRVRTAISP